MTTLQDFGVVCLFQLCADLYVLCNVLHNYTQYHRPHLTEVLLDYDLSMERKVMIPMTKLTNDDICRLCNVEKEIAAHLLCNSMALELNRYLNFSVGILDPSDIAEVPLNRIVSFIDSSQFLKEL